ncbi:MAG TPA: dTDP-glucose 4,6-dehydratase [Candidatus Acidoferrales bacterium]|nr:dTDP-glucose 4,6-dehydratase [Candidatus Acidoferrales bacterium]
MLRILVTGGAGFIGSNFVRFWIRRHPQDRLVNLDKLTYAGNLANLADIATAPHYRFVRGDIGDFALVDQLFREEKINRVVHFAAESHVDRSILGPGEFIRTNINGTFTLLEAARAHWRLDGGRAKSADRGDAGGFCFLHVSTDEVYGSLGPNDPAFAESTPYAPRSPYSATKAASDHLVSAYGHTFGVPVIITNCSNNYGPYQFPEKLIPLTIQRAIKRETIPVYGKGENVRDWIYVEDHCEALEAVLERGKIGETYNIGGGNQWRNLDLVQLICDKLDERLGRDDAPRRKLIRFVEDRPGHDLRYAMDIGKISRALGWTPKVPMDVGIAKTIDWYLAHQDWVERVMSGEYKNYFARQYGARLR